MRVISSHDPEERRKQNSPTSRGHEPRAQHLTGLLGLPEVPACSPLRPGLVSCFLHTHSTPFLPTAPTGLSLSAASSRKPSLITTGWGEMPLLPLSQLPTPTHAAAPATLGGKNPSVGLSPSAGLSSTGRVRDLVGLLRSVAQRLPQDLLPNKDKKNRKTERMDE